MRDETVTALAGTPPLEQAAAPPAPTAPRPRRRWPWLLLALGLLGATSVPGYLAFQKLEERRHERRVAEQRYADRDAELKRRLVAQRMTFNFDQTPLTEAVDFFRDVTGVDVHVTPAVRARHTTLTLQMKNASIDKVLDRIRSAAGDLGIEVSHGALVFFDSRHPPRPPKEPLALPTEVTDVLARKPAGQQTFNFEATPFAEVASFLEETTGVPVATPGLGDRTATLQLRKTTFVEVLDVLCYVEDLECVIDNGKITLQPRSD